ncbi:MAG: hypothetical protein HY822_04745 [Acidobacteria bacterium]|nr:hypothetical protein [Acidobacteriota bacterium]
MLNFAWTRREWLRCAAAAPLAAAAPGETAVHPRVMLTPELVREIAAKVSGPFAAEYRMMTETARLGPRGLDNQWSIPGAFMEAGLAWLVERELGRDGRPFAEQILALWRQPQWQTPGLTRHFGWQGLLFDWICDAMTPEERARFGELLGEWVATWWNTSLVNIPRSGWWYNQHWGPGHLDIANHRVALTAKLFMSLATAGNAGRFEEAVRANLKSFDEKFRADGQSALDEMGGVWSESSGHGGYGPLLVIPLAMEAVNSGLGLDPFAAGDPRGFLREYIEASIYGLMPHNLKLAYIDDSSSGYPVQQARCAPLFARHYGDPVARWLSDLALERHWMRSSSVPQDEVWQRIAFLPADLKPKSPRECGWPLARLFRGAGHVYMLGAWDDPNATWAFFGAGPSYAGHSRDDEGHFLITRRGQLVNRSGGQGHNDNCYYSGGSLIYNIVTVYHPGERMRRSNYNENDGGLVRHVYEQQFPIQRGHLTAYWHDDRLATYAAADLTQGYWAGKVREVTRQFLYLRGSPECFVIFDRVESTSAELPKVWFLHLPAEPVVSGDGNRATWTSAPAGDTGAASTGASRAVLETLAPAAVSITKRGGAGHDFWGHPHNPAAQYNHTLDKDGIDQSAYRLPPYSPWRLEVEPTVRAERDCFLHVLFVADEPAGDIAPAERIERDGMLGARFSLGGRAVEALFRTAGPAGGRLSIREGSETLWDADLPQSLPQD